MHEFKEAMRLVGINCLANIISDEKIHRFASNGRGDKNCWYVFFGNGAAFGDWSRDINKKWRISTEKMSPAERNQLKQQIADAQKAAAAEQLRKHNEASCKALSDWNGFSIDGNSSYLTRKQAGAFDIRYATDSFGGFIVVPLQDMDGKLWSYQKVYDEKPPTWKTNKCFLTGGRKKGCFHVIGGLLENATIAYVAEGYATGVIVHMATDKPVIITYDSGNINAVIESIRKQYPKLKIVICGDEDLWKEENVGRKKAEEAAHKYSCSVIFPSFKNTETKPTDFNDLHVLEGLDEVKKQFEEHALSFPNSNSIVIRSANIPTFPHGYRVAPTGIEYLKGTQRQGEEYEEWKWLCSSLIVTAHTCDENDCNFGRILEFVNSNGFKKEYIMPMEFLSGNGEELRKELLSRGVIMATENEARHRLNAYISSSNPVARAICVDKVGWFRNQYVLPEKVYGQQNDERVVFQSKGTAPKIICSGSLLEWQEHIGKYILGNPILCVSTCAALASPLVHLLHEENFAIHLSGGSSIGKTTAIRVASSVCGNPIHSWRTTDNAAESLARNANDSVLIFDELGEVDAKSADNMSYMLGNGSGKARANKGGDARPITKFRAIILSAGEVGLESKLAEIGKSQRAGQSVRFIEIQADAGVGHGIYKELHDFERGEHLSEHLKQDSELCSGAVMDAWLIYLTQNKERQEGVISLVKALRDEWVRKFVPTNSNEQVKRCARKFAFLAAVGEVLIFLGVLPGYSNEQSQDVPKLGALSESINELFQSWVKNRGGEGSHELTEIIKDLDNFINLHGSSRFEMPWNSTNHDSEHVDMNTSHVPSDQKTYQRAGYKKLIDTQWHYYFYPCVLEKEVLKGKDKRILLKALADKGILKKSNSGGNTHSIHIPGEGQKRLICILSDAANMGGEND